MIMHCKIKSQDRHNLNCTDLKNYLQVYFVNISKFKAFFDKKAILVQCNTVDSFFTSWDLNNFLVFIVLVLMCFTSNENKNTSWP